MAIWLLYPFGGNIGLLIIPLLIMNIVGPPLDVSGRMLFLSKEPEIRTRLTAVYIIIMFLGGGIASWLGAAAYELGGWTAISTLAIAITTFTVLLSLAAVMRYDPQPLFRR